MILLNITRFDSVITNERTRPRTGNFPTTKTLIPKTVPISQLGQEPTSYVKEEEHVNGKQQNNFKKKNK